MNMRPGGFGEHFNTVFAKILEERLEAKHRSAELSKRIEELEKELAESEEQVYQKSNIGDWRVE